MENIKKLTAEYNETLKGDSVAKIAAAKELLNKAVAEYNEELQNDFFAGFAEAEAPMLTAITKGEIPQVRIKLNVSKDGVSTAEVDEVNKVVNLVLFEDFCKTKVSVNGGWRWKIEPFTRNMLRNLSGDIGAKADFSKFQMSKKAEQSPIAYSNTQLTKQLQEIVDGIVEGYKVDSRDLNYVKMLSGKKGKKLRSITNIRPQTMLENIEIAVNRIVTGGEYTVEFRVEETAKAAA